MRNPLFHVHIHIPPTPRLAATDLHYVLRSKSSYVRSRPLAYVYMCIYRIGHWLCSMLFAEDRACTKQAISLFGQICAPFQTHPHTHCDSDARARMSLFQAETFTLSIVTRIRPCINVINGSPFRSSFYIIT